MQQIDFVLVYKYELLNRLITSVLVSRIRYKLME